MNKTPNFLESRKKEILQGDILFDTAEAAEYLKISIPKIYSLVRAKKIPFYKSGHSVYFFKSQLTHWINEGGLRGNQGHYISLTGGLGSNYI